MFGRLFLRGRFSVLLVAALLAESVSVAVARAQGWRAAVAQQRITPDEPLWLAGYGGRDHPAEGIEHDLWVKVLALADASDHRAVLITADLLGFSRSMVERIHAQLAALRGLTPAQIRLAASHTHSGPVVYDSLLDYYPLNPGQLAQIEAYTHRLEDQIVAAVLRALDRLEPAELLTAEGRCTFAVNRRANPEAEVGPRLARGEILAGPVDHRVPLLVVRRPEGQTLALVLGYACHNTTLDWYRWCGDYAGFAQLEIQARHPGTLALFHAGCGADQNPLPRRQVELCRDYGNQLADAVDQALQGPLQSLEPELQVAAQRIALAYERLLTREEVLPQEKEPGIRGRWARRLVARWDAGEPFAAEYDYPISVWRLGRRLVWVTLAGEAVVDYADRFRAQLGPDTWTSSFTDELVAYIPSRRVWQEGGYEGGSLYEYGLPAERWQPDLEARIAEAVERLARSLGEPAGNRP